MMKPSDTITSRDALQGAGLRATRGRVEVYEVLAAHTGPISHREACEQLPQMDRVTVFRNLVALTDAGLVVRSDVGDRVWRYALATAHSPTHEASHPHFTCTRCGEMQCLAGVQVAADAAHSTLLDGAEVLIRGVCDCCR